MPPGVHEFAVERRVRQFRGEAAAVAAVDEARAAARDDQLADEASALIRVANSWFMSMSSRPAPSWPRGNNGSSRAAGGRGNGALSRRCRGTSTSSRRLRSGNHGRGRRSACAGPRPRASPARTASGITALQQLRLARPIVGAADLDLANNVAWGIADRLLRMKRVRSFCFLPVASASRSGAAASQGR